MKKYTYVGPERLKKLVGTQPPGTRITSPSDVQEWITENNQEFNDSGLIIATYIIATDRFLYIADIHSEHIVCAGGKDVLSPMG